jgi:hypothetical protein
VANSWLVAASLRIISQSMRIVSAITKRPIRQRAMAI